KGRSERLLPKLCVFDDHVLELAGFEDLTAFLAFDELGVFLAGDNLHTRMLARCHVASLLGGGRRRGWSHKSGLWVPCRTAGISPGFGGILDRLFSLSSPSVDFYFETLHRNFSRRSRLLCNEIGWGRI